MTNVRLRNFESFVNVNEAGKYEKSRIATAGTEVVNIHHTFLPRRKHILCKGPGGG